MAHIQGRADSVSGLTFLKAFSRLQQNQDKKHSLWGIILCWLLVAGLLLLAFPARKKAPHYPLSYPVAKGLYEERLSGDCVLLYSALPLTFESSLCYTAKEGQKVAKGEAVIECYPLSAKQTLTSLLAYEEALSALDTKPYTDEDDVRFQVLTWRKALQSGLDSAEAESRLLYLLDAFQGSAKGKKTTLLNKRDEAKSRLPSPLSVVYAPREGYLLLDTDGYETVWDRQQTASLTAESVLQNISLPPDTPPKAKLLCDFCLHVAMVASPADISHLQKGKTYSLSLEDGTTLSGNLLYTDLSANDEKAMALFEAMLPPLKHLPKRMQKVSVVYFSQSLLRVPKEAVCFAEGQAYVLTDRIGRAMARGITIAHETDCFVWLSPMTGSVTIEGEKCPYIKSNELVLVEGRKYRHRDILTH